MSIIERKVYKDNPYVVKVTFPKQDNLSGEKIQLHFLNMEIYEMMANPFLSPDGTIYVKVRKDMIDNPKSYPVTYDYMDREYKNCLYGLGQIWDKSFGKKKTNCDKNNLEPLYYGFDNLSEKFYLDVSTGKINKRLYADAILRLGKSFERYARK